LNAREVLRFYGKLQNIHKDKLEKEISDVLKTTGLSENQDKRIAAYSKGMVQRLAFAQALLGSPDLLILDEPCAGLDASGRRHMIGIINKLKASGKTIILNSHILADVEAVADRGIIINHGKILAEITKQNIKEHQLEDIFIGLVGDECYE
jgi:ABC-2 type transport system ATP-binding protein